MSGKIKNGLEEIICVEGYLLYNIYYMVCKKSKDIPKTILADMENNKNINVTHL